MPSRSNGSARLTSGESSAAGDTLSARKVPGGPAGHGERGADRARLERGAEPAAVRLLEPGQRRARVGRREARQRLVARDAAGGDLHHRLEDRRDGARRARARPRARGAARPATAPRRGAGRTTARGRGPSAWPSTARRRRRAAAARRRRRGPGRRRRPPSTPAACLPTRARRARARQRSATATAASSPAPDSAIANSSPPTRATKPASPTVRESVVAVACRTRSPSAWPNVSLSILKWSRSSTIEADRLLRGHRALQVLLERAVVAQPGQRVGGGERLEVGALARQPPQREPEPDHDGEQRQADHAPRRPGPAR